MSEPNGTAPSIEESLTEIKNRLDTADAVKALQARIETLDTEVATLKKRIDTPPAATEQKKEERPKTQEEINRERQKARKSFRRYSIAAMLIVGIWLAWGFWFDEFGDGEKAGIITKIRHEGILFKTYEGEMLLGGSGSGQAWAFSLDNSAERGENVEKIVKDLEEAQRSGKRVRLFYVDESWVGNWRATTGHLIQRVEFLDN